MRRSDLTLCLITDEVSPSLDEGIAFARTFLNPGAISEAAQCRVASFVSREAALEVGLDFDLQVRLDLFFELLIRAPAQPTRESHEVSCLPGFRTCETARTIFSHLPVSAVSRARPWRVSL